MKKIILLITFLFIGVGVRSQNFVYDQNGSKHTYKKEDIDITFEKSSIKFKPSGGHEMAPALLTLIPTVIDLGSKLTEKALEKSVKKYSAEYSKIKSYLGGGDGSIPDLIFSRTLTGDDVPAKALAIKFKAQEINNVRGFVYFVENIELNASSAKATSRQNTFDYTIEMKITYLDKGEKKVQELSPIVISSVEFGKSPQYTIDNHRTDIILKPEDAQFMEASIKIIETNPAKVRAEKILALFNEHKDSAKTIINNFLPEKDAEKEEAAGGTETTAEANEEVGNDTKKQLPAKKKKEYKL